MIDTNIISFLVKNYDLKLANKFVDMLEEHRLVISVITLSELLFGIKKRGSLKLEKSLYKLLSVLEIVDFEQISAKSYATIRTDLEKRGTPIDANDLFIASHAMSLDAVLVTNNTREFEKIKGLKVEDWSRL